MKVLFVPSNKSHVQSFLPVAREILERGHIVEFLCRDSLVPPEYQVRPFLDSTGFEVVEYASCYESDLGRILPSPFSYRSFRKAYVPFLASLRPDVVVVGNDDAALFERMTIASAHLQGAATLLIQESIRPSHRHLPFLVRVREMGFKGIVVDILRTITRKLPAHPYFRRGYGLGGTTFIATAGDAFRIQLTQRGVQSDRIVVTGQPRLDRNTNPIAISRSDPRPGEEAYLLFCNQPVHCRPSTHDRFFVQLVTACSGLKTVTLVFRLHPRDLPPEHWSALLPAEIDKSRIHITQHGSLHGDIMRADALMTIASTTAIEGICAQLPIGLVNYLPTKWYLPYDSFGAISIVNHPSQLDQAISDLLFNPTLRNRCRADGDKVLYHELYKRDGKSPNRIADLLETAHRTRGDQDE